MSKVHLVRQGETLSTIARLHGFSQWETVWSANSSLRDKRSSPHLLLPGDEVEIPELAVRSESVGAEKKHRFRAKRSALELQIILKDLVGEAIADIPYVLEIGERSYEGVTDSEGSISQPVTNADANATLILKLGGDDQAKKNELRVALEIGSLDPVDTLSGLQARLNNLGFESGPVDGILGPLTERALRAFQESKEIEVTGRPDEATEGQIEKAHGC